MSLTPVEQNIICHTEQIAALVVRDGELKAGIEALEATIAGSDLGDILTEAEANLLYIPSGDFNNEVAARIDDDADLAAADAALVVADTALKKRISTLSGGEGDYRYNKASWLNLSDFTTVGAAASVVNGAIRIGTAYGSWDTQRLLLAGSDKIFNDRDATLEAIVRVRDLNEYGMAFGFASINGWSGQKHSLAASFSPAGASSTVYPEFEGANTTPVGVGLLPAMAVNDVIKINITTRRSLVTSTYTNLSTGVSTSFSVLKDKNAGRVGFANLGTGFDVLSFGYRANYPEYPDTIVIGDSKTAGTSQDGYISWADRLRPDRNVRIFAGPGDRTVEAVQCLPNYLGTGATNAVIALIRNDLASGVAAATWKANYQAIVTALRSDGITNIIHLAIPETIQDQSAATTWLDATYPGDSRMYLPGWVNATHLGADNVHPNSAGSAYIPSQIEPLLSAPVARTNPSLIRGNELAPFISRSNIGYVGLPPIYANNTAADADAALGKGGLYRLTGDRTIYVKP